MKQKEEMSALEAARILGLGLDYVYALIWTGRLEARKVTGRWRVSTAAVEARLQRRAR